MTKDDLDEILDALHRRKAEVATVEAKRAGMALPKRLWETLSAFANSPGGGVVLLGVDESSSFEPVGVSDPGKLQADLASLCDQMEPPLRPLIDIIDVKGKHLVVAEVGELPPQQKPCYYKGAGLHHGAFIRVGDGDREMTPYEVQTLLDARGQPRYDLEPIPETSIDDLAPRLYQPLLERLRTKESGPYRDCSDERLLTLMGALVRGARGELVASMTGWLCFAEYPQSRFPNLCVTFTRYPGERAGELGPAGERFLDDVKIEGSLPEMLLATIGVAKRNMQRRGIVQGLFRQDLWEYPEEVLREVVLNALGHRDLAPNARGAQVQVHMYPNRLEVVSPGGLFGPIQPDQLGEPGMQTSRNEFLMRLLEVLPAPGERRPLCENRGTGLVSVLELLRRTGMSPPRFDVSLARFRLVLPNHTLLDADTLAWVQAVAGTTMLTESQRQALAFLKHAKYMANADYCRLTGVDSRIATRELGRLVELGLLDREGNGRWARYELGPRAGAQAEANTEQPPVPAKPKGPRRRREDPHGQIVASLAKHGPSSARELAQRLEAPGTSVRYWLRQLRADGTVVSTGGHENSPHARYALAPKGE